MYLLPPEHLLRTVLIVGLAIPFLFPSEISQPYWTPAFFVQNRDYSSKNFSFVASHSSQVDLDDPLDKVPLSLMLLHKELWEQTNRIQSFNNANRELTLTMMAISTYIQELLLLRRSLPNLDNCLEVAGPSAVSGFHGRDNTSTRTLPDITYQIQVDPSALVCTLTGSGGGLAARGGRL